MQNQSRSYHGRSFAPRNSMPSVSMASASGANRSLTAAVIQTLCDELSPVAQKIVLVLDQRHTHRVANLYAAFPPAEALRLAQRLEIHHTPKHGSWLNRAEIELSVLARQCLAERMEDQERLTRAGTVWEQARNQAAVRVDWRFTTADARIKLKRLYPTILP